MSFGDDTNTGRYDVLVLTNGFPGLSETFVIDQIAALEAAELKVGIAAHHRFQCEHVSPETQKLAERAFYAEDRIPIVGNLPLGMRLKVMKFFPDRWLYTKTLRRAGILICHFGSMGLRAANSLPGHIEPQIWTIFHGFDISSFVQLHGRDVYRPLFARGDRFLAINKLWVDRLIELGCPEHKISLFRLGVDVDRIPFRDPSSNPEIINILGVGRLVEKKGFEYALRALAHVSTEAPSIRWRFEVIGDGPQRRKLIALAKELGIENNVIWRGAVAPSDVHVRLSQSDLFVLPSVTSSDGDMEGIPVSLMEAMASGVPVISSYHSGIPELIEDHKSGLLAPEKDWRALASNVIELCKNSSLREQLAIQARTKIETEFNAGRNQAQLIEEIRTQLRWE